MLLTISLVIAGLSTGQKLGIAAAGAAFIVFALICSFVVPKRNPNFPGRHMGWYIVVVACFVIGMLAVVLTLGKEKPEASAATAPPPTTTATTTGPTVQGDPVAGKKVFLTAGCTACHTLKAAGSTGTVGPNLDQLKPAEAEDRPPGGGRGRADAGVQGSADCEADPGRRGVRLHLDALTGENALRKQRTRSIERVAAGRTVPDSVRGSRQTASWDRSRRAAITRKGDSPVGAEKEGFEPSRQGFPHLTP